MQGASLGNEIDPGPNLETLRRGDLVFWRGHVAIVEGDGHILHASGHSMLVTSEPLMSAISRIASLYEQPIGFRRP
jgi:cell wall-associated NlpC family hydrolase